MLKIVLVGSIVALATFSVNGEETLEERKNVVDLFRKRQVKRRMGSKWNSWTDSSTDTTDDGMCGCSAYLDDSSSTTNRRRLSKKSSKWTTDTGCGGSSSTGWSKRRLGKKSNKWTTDTDTTSTYEPCPSTTEPFDSFCDCMCACEDSSTVTYNGPIANRRRLGKKSNKWTTDSGCGGSSSTGWSKRRLSKKSGKWTTDTDTTTYEPCPSTTEESFETTSITCQCSSDQPTSNPIISNNDSPTSIPSDKPSTSPTEKPSLSPSDKPTESPTMEPSVMPTPTCEENTDYFELALWWEMSITENGEDLSQVFSGRYNQDGSAFYHESKNLSIWFESVGTTYVFVVGDPNDPRFQLYYIDYVDTWTDDDNPLVDSANADEWEPGTEGAEFVTANMTLYDCEGNNLGTSVYTQYSHVYTSAGNSQYAMSAICLAVFGTIIAALW